MTKENFDRQKFLAERNWLKTQASQSVALTSDEFIDHGLAAISLFKKIGPSTYDLAELSEKPSQRTIELLTIALDDVAYSSDSNFYTDRKTHIQEKSIATIGYYFVDLLTYVEIAALRGNSRQNIQQSLKSNINKLFKNSIKMQDLIGTNPEEKILTNILHDPILQGRRGSAARGRNAINLEEGIKNGLDFWQVKETYGLTSRQIASARLALANWGIDASSIRAKRSKKELINALHKIENNLDNPDKFAQTQQLIASEGDLVLLKLIDKTDGKAVTVGRVMEKMGIMRNPRNMNKIAALLAQEGILVYKWEKKFKLNKSYRYFRKFIISKSDADKLETIIPRLIIQNPEARRLFKKKDEKEL